MLLINGNTQINGALPESSEIPANAVPEVLGRQELLPWHRRQLDSDPAPVSPC